MIRTQTIQTESDPFQCRCGPCRSYWKKNFKDLAPLLEKNPLHRASATAVMYDAVRAREDHPAVLKIGDRVIVRDEYQGVVKFVGLLDECTLNPPTYVGVQLDQNIGSVHNGTMNGKRYFHCPRGHGALVKYGEVVRINPPESRPPVTGNEMFPSYKEVKAQRKLKQERAERQLQAQKAARINRGLRREETLSSASLLEVERQAKDAQKPQQKHQEKHQRQRPRRHKKHPVIPPDWKPKGKPMDDAGINKHVQKWQPIFAESGQGNRMANTLKKLHLGYRKGFDMMYEMYRHPPVRSITSETESGSESSGEEDVALPEIVS